MAQTLMLIDGNSVVNRAYFALPALNDKQGTNINAVYGFTTILFKALVEYKPDRLIVAFDKHGHNFRKDLYEGYKANRRGMPEDLAVQMPILHQLLDSLKVTVVEKPGVEADDIIGTISKAFDGLTVIVSGDNKPWVKVIVREAQADFDAVVQRINNSWSGFRGEVPLFRGVVEPDGSALGSSYAVVNDLDSWVLFIVEPPGEGVVVNENVHTLLLKVFKFIDFQTAIACLSLASCCKNGQSRKDQ